MSKNTNLSFLTDYITADITNGRIGINNASPAYAFDVTGIARTSTSTYLATASGNVGIGTISPSDKLNIVVGANGNVARLDGPTSGLIFQTNASTTDIISYGGTTPAYRALNFSTGASTNMTITSAGNVGINSTTPGAVLPSGNGWTSQPTKARVLQISSTDGFGNSGVFIRSADNSTGVDLWSDNWFGDAYVDSRWDNVAGKTYFRLRTAGTPITAMTLTTTGVGIGTTTPDQLLCLRKTSAGAETIALALQNVAGTAGTTVSMVFCPHESSATPEPLAKIAAIRMAAVNAPTDLAFYTYGTGGLTEKMRVLSAGDLVVGGTTSPLAESGRGGIVINGSLNSLLSYTVGGTIHGYIYHGGSNGNMYLNNSKNNATTYVISYTNGVYLATNATSWTANSDIRLKNIISPIDSAVNKLNTLNPVIFSWKSDEENKENIGLIAQDVKEVFPQVIDTNEDGFLGVRYVELVPILVKAIQELSAEITILKNK